MRHEAASCGGHWDFILSITWVGKETDSLLETSERNRALLTPWLKPVRPCGASDLRNYRIKYLLSCNLLDSNRKWTQVATGHMWLFKLKNSLSLRKEVCMFSDHNKIKWEINSRQTSGKSPNIWKSNIHLNNPLYKGNIKRESILKWKLFFCR